MIKAGSIAKGMFILIKGDPYQVAEREFVNPGKGSAFVRLKLKNLKTGQVLKQVNKSQETLEDIEVNNKSFQFLYSDDSGYHFMDTETYEQIVVPKEGAEDRQYFLKEGEEYQLVLWENTPIEISLPYKMVFEVTEAEHAIKGDTVSGGSKPVTTETGLQVKVPLFIKKGDKILINTETKEYLERVNQ
ncbi:MAG: elongation factor P [Spirochaetales bacterium]|nr:elongation factor P [Spirochaetales bacterium]